MDCPQATLIADFVDGRLAAAALDDVDRHLDRCPRCAELVAIAVSTRTQSAPALGWRPVLPSGTQLGRYVVKAWIGRGGMGDVYEGFDPKLERRVAIKLLLERGDDSGVAQRRLEDEARSLARLSHPHVVAALDIGLLGDQVFLVMELVRGPTLAAWLAAEKRTWRETLRVFVEAGEGLAAAHDVGIIHRDFKPQNVLLGGDGKARVSDFGLAFTDQPPAAAAQGALSTQGGDGGAPWGRLPTAKGRANTTLDRAMTMTLAMTKGMKTGGVPAASATTGVGAGTLRYMAPEQLSRQPLDARCDQFSFCVALQEALSGRHPFGDGLLSLDGAPEPLFARSEAASSLSGLPATSARALTAALQRGLARDPGQRYASLRELLAVLRDALAPRANTGPLLAWATLCAAASTVGVVLWISERARHEQGAPIAPPLVQITGIPADWTDSARVLATVPGDIRCLVTLPDRRTLRFVWGQTPPQAEDVDAVTGVRRASPLVPAAYGEGCPDLAPNGRDMVFQGYDPGGRTAVLRSPNADGREAQVVVPAASPTLQSEPKWLAGNSTFVFDVDERHAGVFDAGTGALRLVPAAVGESDWSMTKLVAANEIFLVREDRSQGIHLQKFSWPDLVVSDAIRIEGGCANFWHTSDGRIFYCAANTDLVRLDLPRRQATRLAHIAEQVLTYSSLVAGGIGFVSLRQTSDVWLVSPGHPPRPLTHDGHIHQVASCGARGFLVVKGEGSGSWEIWRVDAQGRMTPTPANSYADAPACSATTDEWWYVANRNPTRIEHCRADRCAPLAAIPAAGMALSPDEKRLAFLATGGRGGSVQWIGSHGGPVHVIADTETFCTPRWSSNDTLWISRRRKGKLLWTEVFVDSGENTGRTTPGSKSCIDDELPDPLAPLPVSAQVLVKQTAQVRFMPAEHAKLD